MPTNDLENSQALPPAEPSTAAAPEGSTVKAVLKGPAAPRKRNVLRNWKFAGLGLMAVVMTFSLLFSSKPKPPVAATAQTKTVLDLDPANMQQKSWQAQSQGDILQLKDAVNQLKQENAELKKEAAQKPAAPAAGGSDEPAFMLSHEHKGLAAGAGGNLDALPPPPPPLPPLPSKSSGLPGVPAVGGTSSAPATEQPRVFDAPATSGATPAADAKGSVSSAVTKANGLVARYAKNDFAGYLPAGSFAPIALLHGLDAAASATAQANPQPVLMRIQDNAVLPGASRYQLKSCFALGSAFGDLSSERVYVRLAKLSCIDKEDRLALASSIKGYVVDSDGKLGLRGVLINRQGAKLAAALMAGFAQGLSGAFGSSMGTTMMSPMLGTGMTVSGSQAMQMAGMGGVSGAAQQLATFYLQQAQAIFPVISINAGREGTIVIEEGTSLDWRNTENLFVHTLQAGGTVGAANAH